MSTPDLRTIAGRLFHARARRGLGVKALALDAGLSSAAAHGIEQNPERGVLVGTVLALARELDVHPAWLAFGTGPMEPFPRELRPRAEPDARSSDDTVRMRAVNPAALKPAR